MSKVASMTIGLVLIFMGAQLFMVKSYLLTPTETSFLAENYNENNDSRFSSGSGGTGAGGLSSGTMWPFNSASQSGFASSPASFASFGKTPPPGYRHRLVPPKWVTWPALFMGVVFFLHGLALKR